MGLNFFFDNNIFDTLIKDTQGNKIQRWNESALAHGIIQERTEAKFLSTPFTFLEGIGVHVRDLQVPQLEIPEKLSDPTDIEDLKEYLYNNAHSFFSAQPRLQASSLREKASEHRGHLSKFGQTLFDQVISYNAERDGFHRTIAQYLALDCVQKFNYPENLVNEAFASFTVDILRGPSHGWNLSQARLIAGRWNQIAPSLLERNEISQEEIDRIRDEDYCFKFSSDLVDTDLTHLSTYGWFEANQLEPVVCFTCDPIIKVKFRVGLYKLLITDAAGKVSALEKQTGIAAPFQKFDPQFGRICICCRKTGSIIEVIEVSEIAEIAF